MMLKDKLLTKFCRLPNAPGLFFMQDGALPYWQKDVRDDMPERKVSRQVD